MRFTKLIFTEDQLATIKINYINKYHTLEGMEDWFINKVRELVGEDWVAYWKGFNPISRKVTLVPYSTYLTSRGDYE